MIEGQFLHYDGSAAIDGTEFPSVSLREHREQGGLRSWAGSALMTVAQAPTGFTPELASDAVLVELPDGRHAKALITNILFNGQTWRLELTGPGQRPDIRSPDLPVGPATRRGQRRSRGQRRTWLRIM